MRRVLQVINVLIALVCLAAAGGFYWVFYRALPQTSGSISTNVGQPVDVTRDSLGIPHIHGKTDEDVYFVQGYATAEDRIFQMDLLRRLGAGELSEILGPTTVPSDQEARTLQIRHIAEQIYTELSSKDRSVFDAYARGVNAYIESHRGRYGFEFTALRYDPRPWSVVDSLIVGLNMYRSLTHEWKFKIEKQQMLGSGEADKVNFLFNPESTGAALPGSNAWVVSGKHTADGKPLLSNDMHLEFSIPGIWHAVQLTTPDMNVEGVTIPGVPGVIGGHNDHIAWGMTNLGFDVEDVYVERMDQRTGRYLYQGQLQQARQQREIILVKGGPPVQVNVWITKHGPVFEQSAGAALSLRWTASEPGLFQFVFTDIDRARNWDEFRQALSRFGGPPQNFVYADTDGNIGYHAAGKIPVRRYAGDVPLDGSAGGEWESYVPFDELPQSYNPPDGIIVSANANPFPRNYPYAVIGNFAPPDRMKQIADLLHAGGDKLKPQDMLRIQKDVYSALHHFIAQRLVAAYDKHGAMSGNLNDAIAMLRTWNGQMDQDRAEPLITSLVFEHLRKSIADRASGANGGAFYDALISPLVVEKLLRDQPASWFPDYNALLLHSFTDAMEEGQRLQGASPKNWKWGKALYVEIKNPVGGNLPWIGSYFNIGPWPASGGITTVKQMNGRLGPSERMNFAVGNWDNSLWNLVVGESGNRASSHYKDQIEAWYYGDSFPMPFRQVDGGTAQFIPESR